jgi:WD40 repeat protein
MKRLEYALLIMAFSAALIIPATAQTEEFKSLEFGFSAEYPREMDIDLLPQDVTSGVEDPVVEFTSFGVMTILVGASEKKGLSLERFSSRAESDYEASCENFEVMRSAVGDVNGVGSLEKEYLLEDESTAVLMRDVFLNGDDLIYHISCRAEQSSYRRADLLYFNSFIDSFKVFPIEEVVSGDWIQTAKPIWSSPALADLDGDGELEIVVGSNEGKLYVFNRDGSTVPGFPTTAEEPIRSSPAVADLDGDGKLDVVVGSDDDMLYAWNSLGGHLPGFPRLTSNDVGSSPAIGDLDGDGSPEIVVGSDDRGIYAFNGDGSPVCGFPLITSNSVLSSPAVADLDRDGTSEIVAGSAKMGTEIMAILLGLSTGQVYAADGRGYPLPRFPIDLPSPSLSDLSGSYIGYSSPILADLDGDGRLEIVIGAEDGLYALNLEGEDHGRFPRKTAGSLADSLMAAGDVDGDGKIELVAGATDGRLYLWTSDGSDYPGFPIQTGGYVKNVAMGDIDGDGQQEILGGSRDNRVHAWNLDGTEVSGFPKVALGDFDTTPAIGDLEGDGVLEMVAGSDDGRIYIWEISESFGDHRWPMIGQNLRHSGAVPG